MIDLLLGGSPCQGFSFAGKQLNFFDPRSKLFFDYVKALEGLNPKYFILENVQMKQEYQDIISKYLGVQPIEINSALVSAQSRQRLYWTNIPNVVKPTDKTILLKDIIQEDGMFSYIDNQKTINRVYKKNYLQYDINGKGHGSQDQRAYYLNNKHGCLDTGCNGKSKVLLEDGRIRHTTIQEKEILQTLPIGYTKAITENQASKAIGNGWTVDVIAHILSFIPGKHLQTVISLFDGISCGQVALERAAKIYNQYYASEIDQHAIRVTMDNYPHTMQLGDVTQIDWELFIQRVNIIQKVS
jgi:site-specific DNA-cytosine methylase